MAGLQSGAASPNSSPAIAADGTIHAGSDTNKFHAPVSRLALELSAGAQQKRDPRMRDYGRRGFIG
jgi:hypothetical protein